MFWVKVDECWKHVSPSLLALIFLLISFFDFPFNDGKQQHYMERLDSWIVQRNIESFTYLHGVELVSLGKNLRKMSSLGFVIGCFGTLEKINRATGSGWMTLPWRGKFFFVTCMRWKTAACEVQRSHGGRRHFWHAHAISGESQCYTDLSPFYVSDEVLEKRWAPVPLRCSRCIEAFEESLRDHGITDELDSETVQRLAALYVIEHNIEAQIQAYLCRWEQWWVHCAILLKFYSSRDLQ